MAARYFVALVVSRCDGEMLEFNEEALDQFHALHINWPAYR